MKTQNIQVYTHDSIGLGEDGPTHQPVEQTLSTSNSKHEQYGAHVTKLSLLLLETSAIERKDGPSALIFSRQNLAQQDRDALSKWQTSLRVVTSRKIVKANQSFCLGRYRSEAGASVTLLLNQQLKARKYA
ncbi:hypothetical protein O9992_30700 [Vibrio lentus]|nr:hypothetical protein [Vibrio lentus]